MINLVNRLKSHLQGREDVLRCFCDWESQLEGWFKGEILVFLSREGADFDREVNISPLQRRKVDFQVVLTSQPARIELKHWIIGNQKGTSYNARWYFSQGRNKKTGEPFPTGIQGDFDKLCGIEGGEKYILVATSPRPLLSDWKEGIQIFNERARTENSRIQINCLTDVNEYPDYFFLGLLRLEMADI